MDYDIEALSSSVGAAGYDVFWLGPASWEQIEEVERQLGRALPPSFREFLHRCGGGGIVSAEISGIEHNDASLCNGGTVLGDTGHCREWHSLPEGLTVIYYHDEEICWCLDQRAPDRVECPVVSFNVLSGRVDATIAPDFMTFILNHFRLYGEASPASKR